METTMKTIRRRARAFLVAALLGSVGLTCGYLLLRVVGTAEPEAGALAEAEPTLEVNPTLESVRKVHEG